MPLGGFDAARGPVEIGVRPEHMRIVGADGPPDAGALALDADVGLVEKLGDVNYVHLTLADGTQVVARADREAGIHSGRVRVLPDLGRALLFGPDGSRLRSPLRRAA